MHTVSHSKLGSNQCEAVDYKTWFTLSGKCRHNACVNLHKHGGHDFLEDPGRRINSPDKPLISPLGL